MKLHFLLVAAALFAGCASAQVYPIQIAPLLREYLQLSGSQLDTILVNNADYYRWASEKQTRILQVQTEIAVETAREDLDSAALGVRYAEIELICRDVRSEVVKYQAKNVEVLTDPQKAKLKVLEDAMKLGPIIAEAQARNLLGTGVSGSGFSAGFLSLPTGCSVPQVRFGDFSASSRNGATAPPNVAAGIAVRPTSRWFNATK